MTALQEYKDYLIRINRSSENPKSLRELNKEKLNREVAKSYGLSESEIDGIGMDE